MVLDGGLAARYRIGMNKLRLHREKAKLSQGALAKKIGTHQSKISLWEKEPHEDGYRLIPLAKAKEAATILNCLLTELRPDLLTAKSIDVLLEGAPQAIREDIRNYAIFRLGQRS